MAKLGNKLNRNETYMNDIYNTSSIRNDKVTKSYIGGNLFFSRSRSPAVFFIFYLFSLTHSLMSIMISIKCVKYTFDLTLFRYIWKKNQFTTIKIYFFKATLTHGHCNKLHCFWYSFFLNIKTLLITISFINCKNNLICSLILTLTCNSFNNIKQHLLPFSL